MEVTNSAEGRHFFAVLLWFWMLETVCSIAEQACLFFWEWHSAAPFFRREKFVISPTIGGRVKEQFLLFLRVFSTKFSFWPPMFGRRPKFFENFSYFLTIYGIKPSLAFPNYGPVWDLAVLRNRSIQDREFGNGCVPVGQQKQ